MSDTIILHMSDLHFSSKEEDKNIKDSIMQSLLNELETVEASWKPILVCVSGDIVDRYDVEAYPIAKEWFEKVSTRLNVPIDHFLFTPGNHDCSRDIMKYPKLTNIDDEDAEKLLGNTIPTYLSERFEEYDKFCKSLQVVPYKWNGTSNYLVGHRVVDNIVFWGCNTEWFSYDDNSELRVGESIIDGLQQDCEEYIDLKKIALMHHGTETGFCEREIQYHNNSICPALHHLWKICDMTLYGHSHEQTGGDPNKMEDHCFTVKAGSTSLNKNYSNNVNLIRLKENSFEIKYVNYCPQDVEHHWVVSLEKREHFWNADLKSNKTCRNISDTNINDLREKVEIYSRNLLENKLRQIKIEGVLPNTILRNVEYLKRDEKGKITEKTETISLEEIISVEKRVIVQGDLGAGKSTILAQSALLLLDENADCVPILVPAKELAVYNDGTVASVLEGIIQFLIKQLLIEIPSIDKIVECAERVYLLVDGLDEVNKNEQESLMRILEQVPSFKHHIVVVLSTRTTEAVEYHKDNWFRCMLRGLQQQEILQIIRNEAIADQKEGESEIYAKKYLKKINQNPMIRLVANTPLAVRMLYHVIKNNEDVENYTIGDLLDMLLEERIKYWDEKNGRNIQDDLFEQTFRTLDEKKNFIGYLAYQINQGKVTRKKLELLLRDYLKSQINTGLLVEQALFKLNKNGMVIEQNGDIAFTYRPLEQIAMGNYIAEQIVNKNIMTQEVSVELWREVSFAAGKLRQWRILDNSRKWFVEYMNQLKIQVAGLTKGCYICYESKDNDMAINMIGNFEEKSIRPLWYYEEEKTVSLNVVAQTISIAGVRGVDWFLESYLNLSYPVINAGSSFFSELYCTLAPLIKNIITKEQKQKLQRCIEPLEYICPVAYIDLPKILCYLMPDSYSIDRRLQLISDLATKEEYQTWALTEYKKMCEVDSELCDRTLKSSGTYSAAYIWMNLYQEAPNINMLGNIIKYGDQEFVCECRKRLGQLKYNRFLKCLLASSQNDIAAAAAFELCNENMDDLWEVRGGLVGGMINSTKHNRYENKISKLIEKDGELNEQWIKVLFAREYHIYGASEGSWRIFLKFLVKTNNDMSSFFIKNLAYMGPFLLSRCEETRLLLRKLVNKEEYKKALLNAISSVNPEISHAAAKVGLVACPELEKQCIFLVLSEMSFDADNFEWQEFLIEKRYQDETIIFLKTQLPSTNGKMREFVEKLLLARENTPNSDLKKVTDEEFAISELENASQYGISYLRHFINLLKTYVNEETYQRVQKKCEFNSNVEELFCFKYGSDRDNLIIDWSRLLWYKFVGKDIGIHEIDTFALEIIAYGKEKPEEVEPILNAVKVICEDERLEKDRWVSNYHWLLVIEYSFGEISDTLIRNAFMQKEEYLGESSLALASIYSGDLSELNIKRKVKNVSNDKDNIGNEEKLLQCAKESEVISKDIWRIIQIYVSSIDSCEHDYIENLISKGKNGTLIAGVLSYCYGMPIPMQSGMIVHQIYFPWKKIESEEFVKMLQFVRRAFATQIDNSTDLDKYKEYLTSLEEHIEEFSYEKSYIMSECFSYLKDSITTKKIAYYIDMIMDNAFFSEYTNSIWRQITLYIKEKYDKNYEEIIISLQKALYKIIGSCEKHNSYKYEDSYSQISIAVLYWYLNKRYESLAQPIFEQGIISLFQGEKKSNRLEKKPYEIFSELHMVLELLPRDIFKIALEQMKYSWIKEARILAKMLESLK
jgi:predicted phosphodiesterase